MAGDPDDFSASEIKRTHSLGLTSTLHKHLKEIARQLPTRSKSLNQGYWANKRIQKPLSEKFWKNGRNSLK
jgi:hypothetical protein